MRRAPNNDGLLTVMAALEPNLSRTEMNLSRAGMVMRDSEMNVFMLETFVRGLGMNVFVLETFMRGLSPTVS
jgi:hypothetical protein